MQAAMLRLTRETLAEFDGKQGGPAYVAYRGCIYDVSDSWAWRRGRHWARHSAGVDLTDCMGDAPHGEELLARCPMVGVLVDEIE